MRARSLLAVAGVVALTTSACAASTPPRTAPSVASGDLHVERLRSQLREIAELRRAGDARVEAVLTAVRELERFVAGMREPDRHAGTGRTWPAVHEAFAAAELEGLREPLLDLALLVDDARLTLRRARASAVDTWERAYLDAEDEVLVAVREYARVNDRLVRALARHWDTYRALHDASVAFVDANEVHRSGQEAVAAYEVRVGRLLDALAEARAEIAELRQERRAAAAEVNTASTAAARRWAGRPPAGPAPGATGDPGAGP